MKEKDLSIRIRSLLKEKNGIILAHNYQPPEIQDIADLTGDSLELSRKAAQTDAEVIVFAGVLFMAETASILCPEKTVILPRLDATCPMADMIDAEDIIDFKKDNPNVPVITYVNSTASVKAETDICCTSANCIKVVNSMDTDKVFMCPDQNLAKYSSKHTEKKVLFWEGYCPVHHNLRANDVINAKKEHPDALFLAHPECREEVLDIADVIASTSGMLKTVAKSQYQEFIIGTESGIIYPMQKLALDKKFYDPGKKLICPNMKKTGLNDVLAALETMENIVKIPEDIRIKALSAVKEMIKITG